MLRLGEIVVPRAASDQRAGATPVATTSVTLSFEDRRRSRLLVRLGDGREAALMLPRGTVLRDGDLLRADTGLIVVVRAAAETLSVARTSDPHRLTRAAYHLGNRHVPLQIGPGWLAFGHDHVLDGLVRELGLEVTTEVVPFEPEAGGYRHRGSAHATATHGHAEGQSNSHDHGPGSDHAHAHGHDHAHDHVHIHDDQS